jgi:hypothetical protein
MAKKKRLQPQQACQKTKKAHWQSICTMRLSHAATKTLIVAPQLSGLSAQSAKLVNSEVRLTNIVVRRTAKGFMEPTTPSAINAIMKAWSTKS